MNARRSIAVRAAVIACVSLALAVPAYGAVPPLVLAPYSQGEYPSLSLLVSLPAELTQGDASVPAFTVTENGATVEVSSAEPLEAEREPVDVVLAVDTSGSMKGEPLADAQAAAHTFMAQMESLDRVALVQFASAPKRLVDFTSDRVRVDGAISGLSASGETAVYDALVQCAKAFSGRSSGRRAIVLLSDGGDTVSGADLDAAVRAVKSTGAPVYVVALTTSESNPNALKAVAQSSGGRFIPVVQSTALAELYQGIARELTGQYVLTYTSADPATTDLEVGVTASVGGRSSTGSIVLPNPSFGMSAASARPLVPGRANPALFVLAIAAVFGAAACASGGVLAVVTQRRRPLERVAQYDQTAARAQQAEMSGASESRRRLVEAVEYVAGRRGLTRVMSEKLEAAGLPLRVSEYMYFHLLAVLGVGVVLKLLTGSTAGAIAGAVATVALPLMALEYAISRRRRAFEEQLPDILNLLAGSLRAGWGLLQAIGVVVEQMPPPASAEFRRVETEARLGLSVEDALEKMATRLGSDDFRWTVTAINIQREVGGNLAEILDIVAATMRDRAELRRHIESLTAEGRLSGSILILLPFIELAALLVVNPSYLAIMFTSPFGWTLAFAGAGLMIVGALWLRKVMRVEV